MNFCGRSFGTHITATPTHFYLGTHYPAPLNVFPKKVEAPAMMGEGGKPILIAAGFYLLVGLMGALGLLF